MPTAVWVAPWLLECAKRGYDLFLTDVDNTCLGALKHGLERRYDICAATYVCDLTDSDDIGGHIESCVQHLGADVAAYADCKAAAQPMECGAETVAGAPVT